jgi:hypothetical protein
MVKSNTLIIGIIILAVVMLGGFYFFLKMNNSQIISIPSVGGEKETGMPKATGKVEDLEASITGSINAENSLYNQEDSDVNTGLQDNNEISDFGQVVNENEF